MPEMWSGRTANCPMTEAQQKGEACSKCGVEFDGSHGTPVLCHHCHDQNVARLSGAWALPKAWLEEKVK